MTRWEHPVTRCFVSVALCTYNGASFIRAQLESILNQTHPPDEVIVCDDASSDNTVGIVASFADKQPSVVHLIQNQQRMGLHKNFEQAIEHTQGDIIFLADQDDVWLPKRVDTVLHHFSADATAGLVYSNATIVNSQLQATGNTFFDFVSLSQIDNPTICDVVRFGGGIPGCLIAIHSVLRPFITPINPAWAYDHYIAFVAYALRRVVKIDEPLMQYRRHDSNSSSNDLFKVNWLANFSSARKASSIEFYHQDRIQWETMLNHLENIAENPDWRNSIQLHDVIRECQLRVEFAESREKLRQKIPLLRLCPAMTSLLTQKYHRYVRGIRSFGKDVFL